MIALRRSDTEASVDMGHKIEMTDPDLETAVNISLFLDVLYGKKLDLPDGEFGRYVSIGTLLRKYECEAGLNWWRLALRAWSTTQSHDFCLSGPSRRSGNMRSMHPHV